MNDIKNIGKEDKKYTLFFSVIAKIKPMIAGIYAIKIFIYIFFFLRNISSAGINTEGIRYITLKWLSSKYIGFLKKISNANSMNIENKAAKYIFLSLYIFL